MGLIHYTHAKAISLGLGVLVIAFISPSVFGVLFPAANEVSYDDGVEFTTCNEKSLDNESGRSFCTTQYSIVVGNTGKETQEAVRILVNGVPENEGLSWNLLDIVATSVQSTRPEISIEGEGSKRDFTVQNLVPNKRIEFNIRVRGVDATQQLEKLDIEVHATGRVIHSNPTLTVMSRFVRNIFSVFGV